MELFTIISHPDKPERDVITWLPTGHVLQIIHIKREPKFKPEKIPADRAFFRLDYGDEDMIESEPLLYCILKSDPTTDATFSVGLLSQILEEVPPRYYFTEVVKMNDYTKRKFPRV